tara:strand:+ start:169 stop:399 length:231 start_codon:yes stop_codon:yes gene_type:complete
MKGSRLVDVLDDKELGNDKVVAKMNILLATIEAANPSIDHFDLRWVEHKLEEFKGGVVPTREDLEKANTIYKQWKK